MTTTPAVTFTHRAFDDLTLRELHDLFHLRDEVFVVGQEITSESEVDGLDPECVHVIGRDAAGRTVATARLFVAKDPVKVGRIAVHPSLQRQGVGTLLMRYVHQVLGDRPGVMSAQAHLRPWYERLGWRTVEGPYDEAGIPHLRMTRAARA
jgi:ElaA protein